MRSIGRSSGRTLLRVDRRVLGHKQAYAYYSWIRDSFAENKRYDRFARELITAEGNLAETPAGACSKSIRIRARSPARFRRSSWACGSPAPSVTIIRTTVGRKPIITECRPASRRWRSNRPPRGDCWASLSAAPTRNPRTGEEVFAHPLGTANPKASPPGDRRQLLAAWLTGPDNPWFARCFANRMWEHFLGRGIVEPVDDFRLTNPPSNPELLDALAADFVRHDYDVKHLIRTITASRTYRLSSEPNATNERDDENYSRALLRRLDAEVLLDAICQTTGRGEKFRGVPAGSRAIELWDNESPHYFLKLFGRPVRSPPASASAAPSQAFRRCCTSSIRRRSTPSWRMRLDRIARLTDRFAAIPHSLTKST